MSAKKLHVQLLAFTPAPETTVAMAARLCYSGAHVEQLRQRVDNADQSAFLKKLVDMGHLSPIEHVSFTFGVEGISRALLAQITRHRIASFSVQSQRYVKQTDKDGLNYIVPKSVYALGEDAAKKFESQMDVITTWYNEWCALLGDDLREDARFVLPNACETRLVMTMNARELAHMLKVRCCNRAQWEIRAMAWAILGHCLNAAPELFGACGPDCAHGACSEGGMTCGETQKMRDKMSQLKEFVKKFGDDENFATILSDWCSNNT